MNIWYSLTSLNIRSHARDQKKGEDTHRQVTWLDGCISECVKLETIRSQRLFWGCKQQEMNLKGLSRLKKMFHFNVEWMDAACFFFAC